MSGQVDIRKELELTLGLMLLSILFLYAGIILVRGMTRQSPSVHPVSRRSVTLEDPLPAAMPIETADEFVPIHRIQRPLEPAAEPPLPRLKLAPVRPEKPFLRIAPVPATSFHLLPPKLP